MAVNVEVVGSVTSLEVISTIVALEIVSEQPSLDVGMISVTIEVVDGCDIIGITSETSTIEIVVATDSVEILNAIAAIEAIEVRQNIEVTTIGQAVAVVGSLSVRIGENLSGQIDGALSAFLTPSKFLHNIPGDTVRVYFNTGRLVFGATADYTVSESGGVGSGFDTINLTFTPKIPPGRPDRLVVDYTEN